MARLNDLPDELLAQIISYNVPSRLRTRVDFITFMRNGASSKRLLRLTKDTFFRTFKHTTDVSCIYTTLSPRCAYTQVHTDGVLVARRSFCSQVRQANLRLHVSYPQSIPIAVQELSGALERYEQLNSIRVGISTTSVEVAAELEKKVEDLLQRCRPRALKRIHVYLSSDIMGHKGQTLQ